jgi:anti-anti-sigma regulatory factor
MVVLGGSHDAAPTAKLHRVFHLAIDSTRPTIVDLTRVSFINSTVLAELLLAYG